MTTMDRHLPTSPRVGPDAMKMLAIRLGAECVWMSEHYPELALGQIVDMMGDWFAMAKQEAAT